MESISVPQPNDLVRCSTHEADLVTDQEAPHSSIPGSEYEEELLEELDLLEKRNAAKGENWCQRSGKHIMVIYTGGTVGMRRDPTSGSFTPQPHFLERVLKCFRQFNNKTMPAMDFVSFSPTVDSSDVNHSHWERIGAKIREAAKTQKFDGFVVLHGTDTMAYSAAALSFSLGCLEQPVVFTGSQMPIVTVRSDGLKNLVDAFLVASRAPIPEVLIVFDGHILRGNRTTKQSNFGTTAFVSNNFPAIGGAGIKLWYHPRFTVREGGSRLLQSINEDDHLTFGDPTSVAIVSCYPGCHMHIPLMLRSLQDSVKGIIFQAFGSGNAPGDSALLEALEALCSAGKIVVITSLCPKGSVVLDAYASGLPLKKMGCVQGYDMTLEAAYTKLSWLLARKELSVEEIKCAMETCLRGELTHWQEPMDALAPGRTLIV